MFLLLWISNKFYSKCFHSSVFEVVRFQVPFSALEKSIGIHNGRSGRHSPCTINLRYELLLICKIITENLLVNMPFTFFVQKYQIWSCLLVQDLHPVPQFWLENSKSFSYDLTMYTLPIMISLPLALVFCGTPCEEASSEREKKKNWKKWVIAIE